MMIFVTTFFSSPLIVNRSVRKVGPLFRLGDSPFFWTDLHHCHFSTVN